MELAMETEVWILGGTGRSARAIAAELVSRGITPVLVGRDAARLTEAATRAGASGSRTVAAGSVEAMAAEIRRQQPAVVINTIGPFTATAPPVVQACLAAGSDYVDLANDVAAVAALLDMNDIAASSEAAGSPLVRAVLPLVTAPLAVGAVRAFAIRRLAGVKVKARPRPRAHSWGHARLEWADGTVREGWLRVGEAQAYTGAVPAEVARRLLAGSGRPGAATPAALFGSSLAEACGGEYLLDGEPARAGEG
jgi:short subunit dehydrogenase-like uncharacterized protein